MDFPVDDGESARCEAELIQDLFSADIVRRSGRAATEDQVPRGRRVGPPPSSSKSGTGPVQLQGCGGRV